MVRSLTAVHCSIGNIAPQPGVSVALLAALCEAHAQTHREKPRASYRQPTTTILAASVAGEQRLPDCSQTGATMGMAYLLFYLANGPCQVSGVIAVVVLGLYGAAQLRFNMQSRETEGRWAAGLVGAAGDGWGG